MNRGHSAQDIGQHWEQQAAAFLVRRGLKLITRGYRCRLGELDVVASDGASLVIVEVRARRRDDHGSALESVSPTKQRKIIHATRHFLMCNPDWSTQAIRFDVVAFDEIESDAPKTTWVKNAFLAT
jgi:putative endonuclease